LPVRRALLLVLCPLLATLVSGLAACRPSQPAPTPDPSLAGRWEYAGYQIDGDRMTVYARLFGPSDVSAVLRSDRLPDRTEGGSSEGIRSFVFEKLAPGRYSLRLSDTAGSAYIVGVWMPPATVPDLPAGERITLKPGEGFRIKGADLVILFTGVFGESRCPVDVTCVQAGEVNLMLTAYKKGGAAIEKMFSVPRDGAGGELVAQFLVTVHSVSPEPTSTAQPDFSKYEITVSFAGG
jgi:hypothetical protein